MLIKLAVLSIATISCAVLLYFGAKYSMASRSSYKESICEVAYELRDIIGKDQQIKRDIESNIGYQIYYDKLDNYIETCKEARGDSFQFRLGAIVVSGG